MNLELTESPPVELLDFPHPYQAGLTIASDTDSGSLARFGAVHELFCGRGVIGRGSAEWTALGLSADCCRFDVAQNGVRGFGFDLSDSFFLVGDPTTFGMYRYLPQRSTFVEDQQEGTNCATRIRDWIRDGHIDSFHAFLHYTRRQVEPLLNEFYRWCEAQNVGKPKVWINHSSAVTPSGLCPSALQPGCLSRLARVGARNLVGPLFDRRRLPLRHVFAGYDGAKPGSRYYVNDLLHANGLRFVWLNVGDLHRNQISLPVSQQNGRNTILQPLTMDDGVRYWRFERCCAWQPGREVYLRDSDDGYDCSHLLTELNLEELCNRGGTCILYTHWSHYRSLPLAEETIRRFELLRNWSEAGKIWITSTARLLEWTRMRTFLRFRCQADNKRLVIELESVDDPIFGREKIDLEKLSGLSFRRRQGNQQLLLAANGRAVDPAQFRETRDTCWLATDGKSSSWPGGRVDSAFSIGTH